MPLAKCPSCNRTFHVDAVDPQSWYSKRWPHLQAAEFVPDVCWTCRNERSLTWHASLESEVDEFFAEYVRRERWKAGTEHPPVKGRTGRKDETLEIAIFAAELRGKGVIWKHVFKACKEKWPDDKRVDNQEQVRKTWRRHFGPGQDKAD